eukprot:1192030-Prorocentrum_minimum.AAC.2
MNSPAAALNPPPSALNPPPSALNPPPSALNSRVCVWPGVNRVAFPERGGPEFTSLGPESTSLGPESTSLGPESTSQPQNSDLESTELPSPSAAVRSLEHAGRGGRASWRRRNGPVVAAPRRHVSATCQPPVPATCPSVAPSGRPQEESANAGPKSGLAWQ